MSIMGPLSGILSDKYGSRIIATTSMIICTIAFLLPASLSYNFSYIEFGINIAKNLAKNLRSSVSDDEFNYSLKS